MTRPQTVLAFDFGLKRIGIASGDTLTKQAAPRGAVSVSRTGPDWEAITREVRARAPELLVVGAPYNVDGSDTPLKAAAERFAAELGRRFGLPVHLVDERYSSIEASAALKAQRESGQRRRRIQRADIDSAAAAVILGRFLQGEGKRT